MVISVKGGKLNPAFTREVLGTAEREADAVMAGVICLEEPTPGMKRDAANGGYYTLHGKDYARLQIRTIQQLLDGYGFDTPSRVQTLGWQQGAVPLPL
jgi:site-specific DNA-methyltransferase (adenine-specific)